MLTDAEELEAIEQTVAGRLTDAHEEAMDDAWTKRYNVSQKLKGVVARGKAAGY